MLVLMIHSLLFTWTAEYHRYQHRDRNSITGHLGTLYSNARLLRIRPDISEFYCSEHSLCLCISGRLCLGLALRTSEGWVAMFVVAPWTVAAHPPWRRLVVSELPFCV